MIEAFIGFILKSFYVEIWAMRDSVMISFQVDHWHLIEIMDLSLETN